MTRVAGAWRAWRSFGGAPAGVRLFLAARLLNAPLGGLDADLRTLRGRVLSLGSGHGLIERYLAEVNPAVEVDGFELDADRVAVAERTAPAHGRVRIRQADVRDLGAEGAYDAVLAVDVLHHIPLDGHAGIARALAARLRPGGVALVKDIATEPAWQHRFNALHDRLVSGDDVHCRSPRAMADVFAAAGFHVRRVRRLGRLSPYPHYLLVLERPA